MLHQPIVAEPIPALARGWTPALKARFLDRLAAKGNVRAACALVGLSTESAYRLRRRDPDFARGWAAALALARDSSVQVLADRAIDGVEEQIYYRGEPVGTRRRYDARLLLAHLARLDRLVDEDAVALDAARFDELLACIAGEAPLWFDPAYDGLLPQCREAHADESGVRARDGVLDAWTEAAGGKSPRLTRERCEAREAECSAATENARAQAEQEWDDWHARALGAVDALCGWPGSPVRQGLPGNGFPPPVRSAPEGAPAGGLHAFPRTLSTVSTSALALSLSRSPCQGGGGKPGPWPPRRLLSDPAPRYVRRRAG